MSITSLQFKRGTTAQNNAHTGLPGEITVDTETKTLRLHDGSTAGGNELATKSNVYNKSEVDTLLAGVGSGDSSTPHVASSGTQYTIDLANGNVFILNVNAHTTLVFPTPTTGQEFILILKPGAYTVTWPSSSVIRWPNAFPPVITGDIMLKFVADGSRWFAYSNNADPRVDTLLFSVPHIFILAHFELFNSDTHAFINEASELTQQQLTYAGDIELTADQKKFGSRSLRIGGTVNDYLILPNIPMESYYDPYYIDPQYYYGPAAFADYSVDFWAYLVSTPHATEYTLLWYNTGVGAVEFRLWVDKNTLIPFFSHCWPGYYCTNTAGTTPIPLNTWVHFAMSRKDMVTKVFTDGALNVTATNKYRLGGQLIMCNNFGGYIDELRFIRNYAVFNDNFTKPNYSYPYVR